MDFWRQALLGGAAVGVVMAAQPAQAQTKSFDVPAQPAATGIAALARQADVQILISASDARGRTVNAVRGDYSVAEAIAKLLEGTGLQARSTGAQTWVVVAASAGNGQGDGPVALVDEIVVTGTRIRGVPPTAPVRLVSREEIDRSGYSQVGDLIRSLPENFGGGENPGHVGVGAANQNIANASTVNLRGLGDGATLTLLNGRRLPGNAMGQSPDISGIPLASLARVEVVKDGSSAIYGADAVAGVVNFILRKDYDGAEISARLGGATQGGAFEQIYSALGGIARDDWHALFNIEYSDQDGIGVSERDYTATSPAGNYLLRPQERTSALISASRRFGDRVDLSVDALWSERSSVDGSQYSASDQIYEISTDSTSYSITAGAAVELSAAWRLQINATAAESVTDYFGRQGTSLSNLRYENESNSAEIILDGTLFTLPVGDVRSAFGGGWRVDRFDSTGSSTSGQGDHDVGYLFAELNVPLVASSNLRAGLNSLELNVSGRYERYSDYGETSTPKVGLRYVPFRGLVMRTTWGQSFKAPSFQQFSQPNSVIIYPATALGGSAGTVLYVTGGAEDLRPERSTSWTFGAEYSPSLIPSLRLEATYFSIDYADRVVNPITTPLAAMSDPAFASFVILNPSAAQQQAFLDGALTYNLSGIPYDPSSVTGVAVNSFTNAASQNVNGVDLSYRQGFKLLYGDLDAFANATWIEIEQQTLPGAPELALAGTVANVPKFRARAGATWSGGNLSLTAAVNYQEGGTDTGVLPNESIDSLTTVDMNLAYQFPNTEGPFSGLSLALSATNLFDEDPPYVESTSVFLPGIHFDSVNASAVGRFVAVTVRKRF